MSFLFWGIFFLKFWIESEKFIFKNLFKNSFLRPKKEIHKYTEWSEKKNEQNTHNLENKRLCSIGHITYDPYHETEPNNEEIYHHTPDDHIWIDPRENLRSEERIHIKRL